MPLFVAVALARVVQQCWCQIPEHFDVKLDAFSVLPDHIHGILFLSGAGHARPLWTAGVAQPLQTVGHARPLPTVIGSFKSAATRDINLLRSSPGSPVWQRGYFDRIIRDEMELAALREYVLGNPDAWDADPAKRTRAETPSVAPWS